MIRSLDATRPITAGINDVFIETTYRPGMLRAVARRGKRICGEDAVQTAGPVAAVRLLTESDTPAGSLVP